MARHFKKVTGVNAEVVVAKSLAYTTDATFALFTANAVDGEIGFYNFNTNALIGSNTNIADGTRYYVAQKQGDNVFMTSPITKVPSGASKTVYTAPVKGVKTITFAGVIGTAYNIGDEIFVKVMDTTPAVIPLPFIEYTYVVKAGDSITAIATAITAKINDQNSLEHNQGEQFVTATSAAGVITVTSKFFDETFELAILPVSSTGAIITTVATTVAFNVGSGFYSEVVQLEEDGLIFRGVTTAYPPGGFRAEDFGKPTLFADPAITYDTYNIRFLKQELSLLQNASHNHLYHAFFLIPVETAALRLAVSTILGFDAPV